MRGKNEKKFGGRAALAVLILAAAAAAVLLLGTEDAGRNPGASSAPTVSQTDPAPTVSQTVPAETVPEATEDPSINLGYGLEIIDSGRYTGQYMEDGTNELLSDVMMVIVENTGSSDIQLAEFTAVSGEGEYRFQLTNLAAGQRAVLLDLDRKPSGGKVTSAVMGNAALFDAPMELFEGRIQVTGLEGMVNVKNISDEDITGDIYVYYKYAAEDIFYGGITFRVRVEGGLKAGEIRQIPAGHYTTDGCTVVQVTIYE